MSNFILSKNQPPERNLKKKELYKLHIAISDITAALETCKLIASTIKGLNDAMYYPLFAAVIVCYCRPFTNNKPHGSLSNEWTMYNDPEFQETHNKLINARHEMIAHSDLNVRKVRIFPHNSQQLLHNGKMISNSGIGIGSSYYLFHPHIFKLVQRMILDLGRRLTERQDILVQELYGDMELPNAPFILRFDNGF